MGQTADKHGVGTRGSVKARTTGHTIRSWRGVLAVGALILATATGGLAAAEPEHAVQLRTHKPFPQVKLDKKVRGDEAIRALGDKLPEVADWYGKAPDELARELRQDKRAWLDRDGRLLYIDDFPTPANASAVTTDGTTAAAAPFPTDQTFLLHSRPGAKRVIYLDFLGQVVTGSAWNNSYGLSTIDAKPFDLDSLPTSFSTTELERIQYIWQRVAEDYAPFDVDVTTEEPPADAITRSTSADEYFGTRVVITQDWTSLTTSPCGCGGIAYVGIFDDLNNPYKPAWVFFDRLGGGNEKYVAEAISHEAGHNLGLSHDGYNDGTTSAGYYTGHGTGATGWAPIMGVGYYKEMVQWSKGEYPYATQTQDDFQIIQSTGAPLRADDHGDTAGAATPLDAGSGTGTITLDGSGLIGGRSDVDVFSFNAGPGTLALNVNPASRSPNLDVHARLYDAAGNLLASSNPTEALGTTLSVTTAAAGTFYLFVDGTGKGTLSTGYSDYGSLGEYSVTGSVPAPGGQAPFAVAAATPSSGMAPLAAIFSSNGSYDPDGGALTYDWDFGDGSAHSSAANPSHTYGAGSHTATLRVTDPTGSSATSQVSVSATPAAAAMHVSNIAMSVVVKRGAAQGKATVTVVNSNGEAVSGATVSGTWSGIVSGSASGTTGTTGSVALTSPSTKKTGTLTFTVTNVAGSGYIYSAATNVETADSITR
jgi:PKD repeat protein